MTEGVTMIFSFLYFILFLLITLSVYFIVPGKFKSAWLLLISYVFCFSYGEKSLFILICSTIISYLFGIMLDRIKNAYLERRRPIIFLWSGVLFCIVPFLTGKISQYSLFVGIGMSFYLLQQIGYLVDIYYGKCHAEKNFIQYSLFIAFFPKLVSGPIERSDNLLKQIKKISAVTFDYDGARDGLLLMLWGYFQKSIIADSLAVYVSQVYEQWEAYSGGTLCLATIVFAFQLYADFAGYTNIALGAAQVLGFRLLDNFRQPYLSNSIKEFWRRWHISFSNWLRDYIYIPLGGGRKGNIRRYFNLMITFLVSGFWHGSSWNFVAWGMLHGAFQVLEDICSGIQIKAMRKSTFAKVVKKIYVFVLVDIAWIFFRASGLMSAIGILKKIIFNFSLMNVGNDIFFALHLSAGQVLLMILAIALLLAVDLVHERGICIREVLKGKPVVVRWICYIGITLVLTLTEMRRWGVEASNFIYMQF